MKVADEGRKENENTAGRCRHEVETAWGPRTAQPSSSCPERATGSELCSEAPHPPGSPGFRQQAERTGRHSDNWNN